MNFNHENYVNNAFNDGMDHNYSGTEDSALTFSWTSLSFPVGETKADSFLLGIVNTASADSLGINYDGNGDTGGSVPVDSTIYSSGNTTVLGNTENLAIYGATFNGWNTSAEGTGTPLTMNKLLLFYTVWIPNVCCSVSIRGF